VQQEEEIFISLFSKHRVGSLQIADRSRNEVYKLRGDLARRRNSSEDSQMLYKIAARSTRDDLLLFLNHARSTLHAIMRNFIHRLPRRSSSSSLFLLYPSGCSAFCSHLTSDDRRTKKHFARSSRAILIIVTMIRVAKPHATYSQLNYATEEIFSL